MDDIFGIGGTLGAIGDAIIGGLNYANQKDALEWQKKQQEYMNKWNEYVYEDQKKLANTAVQRYTKDLEAVGINKLMAAGGSAGMGGAVGASTSQITAPHMEANLTEKIGSIYDTVYSMITMQNEIATSQAQRDLIRAQTIDTLENSKNHEINRQYTKEQQKNLAQEREKILYDLEKSMKMNLRTSDTTHAIGNTLSGAVNEGFSVIGDIARGILGKKKRYKKFR